MLSRNSISSNFFWCWLRQTALYGVAASWSKEYL